MFASSMGRPRKNTPPAADVLPRLNPDSVEDSVTSAAPTFGEESEGNKINRVSFPVKADGSGFDFDSMQERNRQKLVELVTAGQAEIFASGDGGGGAAFEGITLANVRATIDSINSMTAIGVGYVIPMAVKHPFFVDDSGEKLPLKVDQKLLQDCFKFTDAQHEELDPRAMRLANRYSPKWLKDNADWVMLLQMYGTYTFQNTMRAIQTQVQRDVENYKRVAATQQPSTPPKPPEGFAGAGSNRTVVA
jgi:hypothetical protein